MPLPKQYHTSKDYWNLPEGQRAELIDGTLYDMAPPSYQHQFLIARLSFVIQEYIFSCWKLPATYGPFRREPGCR